MKKKCYNINNENYPIVLDGKIPGRKHAGIVIEPSLLAYLQSLGPEAFVETLLGAQPW